MVFSQKEYTFTAYRGVAQDGYNFWVSTPDTSAAPNETMPVIIFLHGNSLCGSDLYRVRRYGCLDAIAMGRDINALVIAPQNPGGPWNPKKIMNVLNWVENHYLLDTNRIYVIGMSLGGYGTFDFTATYPDKIAAAMALCGGSSRKEFCGLNKVPLWIIHGTADRDVSIAQSERIVEAMRNCGSTELLRFDKFGGVNHSQLAKMFYLPDTYNWLLSHTKANGERTLNTDISITVADMGAAYQNIDRAANKIVVKDEQKTVPPLVLMVDVDTASLSDSALAVLANELPKSKPAPAPAAAPQKKPAPSVHVVKRGDTLSAIARKYHTSVSKLCKINHIKETSVLSLGQRIRVR
ncbi:MAG: LysM peptidoglycan-binding domain-containing protein [Bacteroidales bacterium]|nr:LysM peptidoglycan-binding domain-containing protein [Bacteroidales bacterium]